MLDLLADLSKRRWPYAVAAVLVGLVVVVPALSGGSGDEADAADTTEESPFVDPTENLGTTTSVAPGGSTTTLAEVDREGDDANPLR